MSPTHRIILDRKGKLTPPGTVEELPEMGMPERDFPIARGSLFVHYTVIYPESLTDNQKQGMSARRFCIHGFPDNRLTGISEALAQTLGHKVVGDATGKREDL